MKSVPIHIKVLLCISFLASIFISNKIIHDLPVGTTKTEYGLKGFDDEPAHLNYVKYLIENQKLPKIKQTITSELAFITNEYEYHQPPVYYYLIYYSTQVFNLNSDNEIVLFSRYFNLFLQLLSFIVYYKILVELKLTELQKISSLIFIFLLNALAYYSLLLSNDILSWLIIWIITYLILRGFDKNYLIIVLFLALGHWVKFNIILIYPYLAFLILFKRKEIDLFKILFVIIVPLIIATPWYFRNYELYGNPYPVKNITGEKWHYVTNLSESLDRLKRTFFTFFFAMYVEPPKKTLFIFNYTFYFWAFISIIWWFGNLKNHFKSISSNFTNILLITNIIAFLYFTIPTGIVEGRQLYPSFPIISTTLVISLFKIFIKIKLSQDLIPYFIFALNAPAIFIVFYL